MEVDGPSVVEVVSLVISLMERFGRKCGCKEAFREDLSIDARGTGWRVVGVVVEVDVN
jgi:hypothetical protein